jgi:hypothetical protein
MVYISLGISILSLVISIGCVLYVRRQEGRWD